MQTQSFITQVAESRVVSTTIGFLYWPVQTVGMS